MANIVSQNTSPTLNLKNIEDLSSTLVERNFGRPEDYIEIYIYDLNNNLLDSIEDFKGYKSEQNTQGLIQDLNLDPLGILNRLGYSTGIYNLKVNIQKRKILNFKQDPPFKIKEISSTRTELKITTVFSSNNVNLANTSRNFIQAVQNSPYFRDFRLNFGKDRNIVAVNIKLDSSNPNENLLQIKLLEPLSENLDIGDKLQIVEDIVDPVILTYDLGLIPITDTTVSIKGPNFKIDTRLNNSVPTAFRSYDDILNTSTTSSYQKLISKLEGYEIPEIDYGYVRPTDTASLDFETVTPTHFENFVHFGSATELLKNFEYKLKLIEIYDKQIHELNTINSSTSNTTVLESSSSIANKKENLIQGFSGYEQYLYFESGAYSWPKRGNHPQEEPYIQAHTTSSEVEAWLGSGNSFNSNYGGQLLSASIFDKQNPNRLMKLVPTFIGDKEENKPFELFCDMIGEHFDPIWTHVKEITQTTDNSHKLGVSKNLVYYMLQNLGIEAYDQFENEDLISYIFGQATTTNDTSTVITGSNEFSSKEDISKEIWKRLYHNAPYLLKTKGTERGLRALINCYGIPDTVLDIKEFGSSNPDRDEFKLYTYNKFSQVIAGNSLDGTKKGMFIETAWTSSNTNAIALKPSSSAKTVEFRIKPTRSGSDAYHLFSLSNHTSQSLSGSDLHLILHPYTGSHDFFSVDDKTQYGKLDLVHMSSSILTSSGHSITSPIELANLSLDSTPGFFTVNSPSSATIDGTQTSNTFINIDNLTAGSTYAISAIISNFTNGSATSKIGFSSTGGVGTTARRTDNGTISHTFTATGTGIAIFAHSGSAGTISDVSVKEILHNSEYFPVFNGNFWNISLGTDGISGSDSTIHLGAYQANHLRDVLHYTSSATISEMTNAESFGSLHYSDAGNLIVNPDFTGFDASAQTAPNWTLQNSGSPTQAATTAIIFKQGGGILNATITLTDANGVSKTYISINASGNAAGTVNGSGQIEFIGSYSDASSKAASLKTAIEHANGHNGSILVTTDTQGGTTNDTLVLTQGTAGTAGNTAVTTGGTILSLLDATPNNFSGGTDAGAATFSTITNGIKVTIDSTPTNPFDIRVRQELHDKLKLHHKYRISLEARSSDGNLFVNVACANGQNDQTNPQNIVDNGPPIDSSEFTYYQATFETTYLSHTNKTTDTQPGVDDGNLILHIYNNISPETGDTFEIRNIQIEELGACSNAFLGGIKDITTGGIITSSFYTNNNQFTIPTGDQLITNGTFETNSDWTFGQAFGSTGIANGVATVEVDGSNTHNYVVQNLNYTVGKAYIVTFRAKGSVAKKIRVQDNFSDIGGLKNAQTSTTLGTSFQTYSFTWVANANSDNISFSRNDSSGNWSFEIDNVSVKEAKDLFTLGYKGSMSEIRYYFGELLNHNTLQQHALEPLMYGGNSISSSYDHLILRYPLSFELDLDHNLSSQIPSTDQQWNGAPSVLGTGTTQAPLSSPSIPLTGPITGGAILSSSLDVTQTSSLLTSYSGQPFASGSVPLGSAGTTPPIFTVAGTPLLQSHHPNIDIDYLDGFTYFTNNDVELLIEEHHLPTPNTIGKSPVNNKVRIDKGTTDDDILSPDILSQLPTLERQVPDFSNIGVFLSPQNEINEDIIYTLGTFSLDEFLGDPREETSEIYEDFKPLVDQYFKKLKKGTDRYNIWDFTRWVSFLDHTLFDLIKSFTPQKSIDKTGILIEPHFLERSKFRRYHPITSRPEYSGTFQDITSSFHKNNNTSLLDGTSGSAVISYTAISSSDSHTNYNTFIDVAKALSGSNSWEQGPIRPIFELVRNQNFTGSQGPSTNTDDWRTLANTTIGSGIATVTALGNIGSTGANWALNQLDVFPHVDRGTDPGIGTPGNGFNEVFEVTFRARQTVGSGQLQVGEGYKKFFEKQITNEFKTYKVRFTRRFDTNPTINKNSDRLVIGGVTINDVFEIDNISVKNLVDTSLEPRRFSRTLSGSSLDANLGGNHDNSFYSYAEGNMGRMPSEIAINGSNKLRPYVLTPRGNFLNAKISKKVSKNLTENKTFKLIDSSNNNLLTQFNFNSDVSGTSNTLTFSNAAQNKKANVHFQNHLIAIGRKYKLTYTISGYSGTGDLQPRLLINQKTKSFTLRTGNGTFIETVTFDGNSFPCTRGK